MFGFVWLVFLYVLYGVWCIIDCEVKFMLDVLVFGIILII